ncbi:hypothetical protein G3I59_32160 [Amycolatopsis rubida]|uniref:Uncharacterized protein n=1 Tax=Amycolatopsis rubida TaxID=112413 RepID=A0ABX0C541_9PSEU|nr:MULTISPECIES: hypothetical protein [Amycolatopsis]NEC55484.1 hypothetical protein [Amycolatopsis rubida]NEC60115.1 hypothetical protein [Amycolatopsis rubida]
MEPAVTLCEAVRAGHPAVIIVCCLLVLMVLGWIWLLRARRPIPAPRGRPTVEDIYARVEREEKDAKARRDHELQATIQAKHLADFCKDAERTAAMRADEVTAEIPTVADEISAPGHRACRTRPCTRVHPRERAVR